MHKAVLADVEEPAAGAAMPLVRQATAGVLLKMIEMRERKERGTERAETLADSLMAGRELLQLAGAVEQDAYGGMEAESAGADKVGVPGWRTPQPGTELMVTLNPA